VDGDEARAQTGRTADGSTDRIRDVVKLEVEENVQVTFPERVDGRVLFPFRRLFLIAYR